MDDKRPGWRCNDEVAQRPLRNYGTCYSPRVSEAGFSKQFVALLIQEAGL